MLNIPNSISLVRLALVPVYLVLQLTDHSRAALAVFAGAMVSDALDGFLARVLNQRTKLGAFLDPLADKALLFSAVVSLVVVGRLPLWLVCVVAFRDGAMIVGALVVRRKRLELPTSPTRIGKYATFAMTLMIVLALTGRTTESPLLDAYTAVVGFIAGLCVVVSTAQYFARFGYLFFAPPGGEPSPDERKQRVA